MIEAEDAVVWINRDTREVVVRPVGHGRDLNLDWPDPIGAHYAQWRDMTDEERTLLMLETAIDLAMQGFPLKSVLCAFATVRQFRALGNTSYPMCRALTKALVGKSLEFNTMSFEELLRKYEACP